MRRRPATDSAPTGVSTDTRDAEREPLPGIAGSRSRLPGWLIRAADIGWRVLVVAAAIALLGWLLVEVRVVALPLAFALLLSTVLVPPQRWLRRRGVPPLAATWLVFLGGVGLLAAVSAWLVPVVVEEASRLPDLARTGLDRVQQWLVDGPVSLSSTQAQDLFDRLRSEFSTNSSVLLRGALRGTVLAIELAAGALLTAVFTFFMVKDGEDLVAAGIDLAKEADRPQLREMGQRAWRVLTGYVWGATVNGLVNGTLMALTLIVAGVPLVLPLAFATFLGAYVPIAGALVAGALAALVALAAQGWATAIVVVAATIVIHHVEAYLIGPVVMGRAVRLRPAAVVAALAIGGAVAGLAGAILAVPVAAVFTAVVAYRRELAAGPASG
jgi:predicted PurR-regulated permease PerM